MKANEVLQILRITRATLCKYVKQGKIKYTVMPNGFYDYDAEDVYKFFTKGMPRKTYIYGRVSTNKQKPDLENQINLLKQFCIERGYTISGIYKDVASGISFDKRKEFFDLLDEVISGRVERVVITYKDRLSRVGFDLFKHLFEHYNCEIVVISEVGSEKLDSQEVFEEIVSLLHCYSMKLYSQRKLKLIKEVIEDKNN